MVTLLLVKQIKSDIEERIEGNGKKNITLSVCLCKDVSVYRWRVEEEKNVNVTDISEACCEMRRESGDTTGDTTGGDTTGDEQMKTKVRKCITCKRAETSRSVKYLQNT